MHPLRLALAGSLALLGLLGLTAPALAAGPAGPLRLTLDEAVRLGLENNRARPASAFAVEIAEAQLEQAKAAFNGSVGLRAALTHLDEQPNFIFPAEPMAMIPVIDPFTGPTGDLVPFAVPERKVVVSGRDVRTAGLDLTYPLLTGGRREAYRRQASRGLDAAREEARRTDLQVVYDVKRYYAAAQLAMEAERIVGDTVQGLEVTLDLTERFYQRGAGKVKKTDYLRNKSMVEAGRAAVAQLAGGRGSALAALVNAVGLPWDAALELSEPAIPRCTDAVAVEGLVADAYAFNPDWKRLAAGLDAAAAGVRAARGEREPAVGLTGTLSRLDSDVDIGVTSPENRNSWSVGLGMSFPVFDGGMTRAKVREARARLRKLEQERVLLREGLGLQVKHLCLQLTSALAQEGHARAAAQSATENRELTERAYRAELIETKEVIEAQIMEAALRSQHQKALYDQAEGRAHLDFVVGRELRRLVTGEE